MLLFGSIEVFNMKTVVKGCISNFRQPAVVLYRGVASAHIVATGFNPLNKKQEEKESRRLGTYKRRYNHRQQMRKVEMRPLHYQ